MMQLGMLLDVVSMATYHIDLWQSASYTPVRLLYIKDEKSQQQSFFENNSKIIWRYRKKIVPLHSLNNKG